MEITNSDIAQRWFDGQTDISDIVDGLPIIVNLQAWITPRIKLSLSEDCNTLYLDDLTDYEEPNAFKLPNVILPEEIEIFVRLLRRTKFGDTYVCEDARALPFNGRLTFEVDEGDGEYCAEITMTYYRPAGFENVEIYTDTFEDCIIINCCQNKVSSLKDEIECRIADIVCKIEKFACIGRNTTSLYNALHRLQNILWCMCNFHVNCSLYELYACDVNRLKNC